MTIGREILFDSSKKCNALPRFRTLTSPSQAVDRDTVLERRGVRALSLREKKNTKFQPPSSHTISRSSNAFVCLGLHGQSHNFSERVLQRNAGLPVLTKMKVDMEVSTRLHSIRRRSLRQQNRGQSHSVVLQARSCSLGRLLCWMSTLVNSSIARSPISRAS